MKTSLWIIAGLTLWVAVVCVVIKVVGFNKSDQEHDAAFLKSLELDPDRRMEDDYRAIERTVAKVRAGGAK